MNPKQVDVVQSLQQETIMETTLRLHTKSLREHAPGILPAYYRDV